MPRHIFISKSPVQTLKYGQQLAATLKGGEVLALQGNLGSGKTTFVKGLAKGLDIKQAITSPTFVLMKVYRTNHKGIKRLIHVDCYRLPAGRQGVPGAELGAIGLGDYLNQPDTVVAVEWGEKLPENIKPTLKLNFMVGKEKSQRIIQAKRTAQGKYQNL